MNKEPEIELGAILSPENESEPRYGGTDVELPDQYIVPFFRDWFGDRFGLRPENVEEWFVQSQGPIPSCIAEACAKQKTAQEGRKVSRRDIYRLAKRLDGTADPTTWGTTLNAGQDAMIDPGPADDELVEDDRSDINAFVSLDDVNEDVRCSREANKGKSSLRVERTDFIRAMFEYGLPLTTACHWYSADNGIGKDGMMGMPTGNPIGGHSFLCIGWVSKQEEGMGPCLVMVNSFGKGWGDNGLFYVPVKDVINRLTSGRIAIDQPHDLTVLLARYNGKDVQVVGSPDIYRCELGVLRKYPDEITWWAFGNLFGFDTYDMPFLDFQDIPKGKYMDISDAPFRSRELVRQLRQHYGKL